MTKHPKYINMQCLWWSCERQSEHIGRFDGRLRKDADRDVVIPNVCVKDGAYQLSPHRSFPFCPSLRKFIRKSLAYAIRQSLAQQRDVFDIAWGCWVVWWRLLGIGDGASELHRAVNVWRGGGVS
jgi:hypothetical protein